MKCPRGSESISAKKKMNKINERNEFPECILVSATVDRDSKHFNDDDIPHNKERETTLKF